MARTRRTQEERSAETRGRLLDATLECLIELGYARTTTTEVAERAGVSRGAQLHHFPTKNELVLAAVEHVFMVRDAEFNAAFARLPHGADRAAVAIDLLWEIMSGDSFSAWLELAVAARTDRELRRKLQGIGGRAARRVERIFRDLFPTPDPPNPFFELAPRFAFSFLYGLALGQLFVGRAEQNAPELLHMFKAMSSLVIPNHRS
jgi:AcrR family transcriptional regulator